MQGLAKIVAFTAPALLLVILLSFWQQREHKMDVQVESVQFDRDWNEQMAGFEKTASGKQRYKQRAAAAQSQYSSSVKELAEKKEKVEQMGKDMDKGLNDIDAELETAAKGVPK